MIKWTCNDDGVTRFRLCGNEWRYCNGLCSQCPLTKIYYSTSSDAPPPKERGASK